MTEDRVASLADPQLRAFLPLLYVAAADLELDVDEARAVRELLAAEPWLRPAARAAIASWLDPARPIAACELARLRTLVDAIAATASPRARRSFVQLAQAVADAPDARAAATRLAEVMGIAQAEASAEAVEVAPPAAGLSGAAIAGLQLAFDGDQRVVRERVRRFLDDPQLRAYGLPPAQMRPLVRGWLGALAATELGALAYPGVTGGTGTTDLRAFLAAFEELGHGDLSLLIKWGVQIGLYGGAIWALGTARHHARLAAVARADELGCFAMSEVGHGSNVADLETIARYDHATRELELHTPAESARKEWIGGAACDARWAVVFAQLEVDGARHGVHAVLVPIRTVDGAPVPGVRTGDCGHKLGLAGVDNGRLWFARARVPVGNLLDRFAQIDDAGAYHSAIASPERRFFVMLGTLVGGRISVGSSAVSAARAALAIALRYAGARRQFGPAGHERTLLDYPSHRRRLFPPLATGVVLRLAFEVLRDRHAELFGKPRDAAPADTRVLEAEVAALKVLGSRHGVDTVQACREACGGQGYLSVNRIAELRVDVEVFTTFEGDNTVLAQLVAKSVLAGYRKQFTAGGTLAIVRALGRRVATAVVDKNPAAVRRTDRAHLRDRAFHLAALAYREDRVTATCGARLKHRLDRGDDADTALVAIQEHVIAVAEAYGERLAFAWFAQREAAAPPADADARAVLARLGDLHALVLLERRAAWFLADGYFEPVKASAIRTEIEALLGELAPHARGIVDAFAIPDACLAAPIAFFDPAHPIYG